ncbi:MAG: hypothetical protein ACUZ8O_16560 [Candidatus Anammoxibacter sp.]
MRLIKNVFLLIVSVIAALVISEITLRLIFPHTPTFNSYFPRYIVDNNPSYVTGLTRNDPVLPFSSVPDYSHTLTDLAYHPKPYKITLDCYGYRNSSEYQHYDNVIVGDSVAFGSGVDDDQTVSAILGQHSKVYNLSISGAGPAMYMEMIDSFLKRKTTDNITILFFLGNDIRNLKSAYWNELTDCLPPKSKITRSDVSASPASPPIILSLPVLRSSFLAHFIYTYTTNLKNRDEVEPTNLSNLHSMISRKAITDLRNSVNISDTIQNNKPKAIKLLNELIEAEGIDSGTKLLINEIINEINNNNIEEIFDKMRKVSIGFINSNRYPIGNDMQNLVSYTNYTAGFFYESINALNTGYRGNIYNYLSLLKIVGKTYNDLQEESEQLIQILMEMEDIKKAEIYSSGLQRKLNRKEQEYSDNIATSCNKLGIFFDYLVTLQKKNIHVSVCLIPAEYQLKRRARSVTKSHKVYIEAQNHGIDCIDLTQTFIEHYSNRQNNALFLDGAHFTVEGNKKVASWIMPF